MNAFKPIQKKVFIRGKLTAQTGLHVGGSSIEMTIGGADSVVLRHPLTQEPYIPGSSIKGKMRSLLEKIENKVHISDKGDYGPTRDVDSTIGKIFGVPAEVENSTPTRIIVRDAFLTEKSKKELLESENTDMPYTEVKTEVVIDRLTSKAIPRQIERVPAGTEFKFEFVLNIYDGDDEKEFLNELFKGMEILEEDYLGGNGTRGYGKAKFTIESLTYKDREIYETRAKEKDVTNMEIPERFLP